MYIRRFTYKEADVDCTLCTEYRGKNRCPHSICPFIAERIEAGTVTYQEAIRSMIPSHCSMSRRLPQLIQAYPNSLWGDPQHRHRMELFHNRLGYARRRNTPCYYAAMYLLTSNAEIHRRTANCFHRAGITFDYAILNGISPHDYSLYCAACGRFGGERCVTLAEMADSEIIDEEAFRLLVNALLIARYGTSAFLLKKEVNRYD